MGTRKYRASEGMEREETGSLEGWRDGNRRDPPGGMEGNRRERVPGGMETE